MVPKAVIGLFLALALQLAQAQTWLAALADPVCEMASTPPACDCCVGADRCPCIAEAPQHKESPPLAPASTDLKIQVAIPTDGDVAPVANGPPASGPALAAAASRDVVSGYAGVPLAVAYCRFLI